jgi:hypothetical protein
LEVKNKKPFFRQQGERIATQQKSNQRFTAGTQIICIVIKIMFAF